LAIGAFFEAPTPSNRAMQPQVEKDSKSLLLKSRRLHAILKAEQKGVLPWKISLEAI
jgi:hypothetical protein